MFDPWASLAELQQPCLYRPISDSMWDANGLVRREVLASLDRIFIEHLAHGRASFQAPASPSAIPADERFLNVSALQKAIRRSDLQGSMRYAQQGCGLNSEQVFRRLATCAVEDVGIGNLLGVAMSLALMGSRQLRENGAVDELAAYLAYILASSPKSRLACDLLSIVDYDRSLWPTKRRLALLPVAERSAEATNRTTPLPQRMAAAWLLAGTTKFLGTAMPPSVGDKGEVLRLMASKRVPLIMYYVADRAASRLRDAMFVSWLFIAEQLDARPDLAVAVDDLRPSPLIGRYPAAAFDLHTSEGRIALGRFARTCPPVAAALAPVSPTLRDTAIRHGVFISEGGLLATNVTFDASEKINAAAHSAELSYVGLLTQDDQSTLLKAITDNNEQLNQLRRDGLS